MKNKFLSKFPNWELVIILLFVLIFRIIIYSSYAEITTYVDTRSYMNYEANIFKGEIDSFRTPIYPYILKVIKFLAGNDWGGTFKTVALFQEIISLLSVAVLFITLRKTFKNEIVSYIATIIYACFPAIFTYNRVILTESLSISFFVMYICLILQYLLEPNTKKTIGIGMFTIFLIFLRPSFIFLTIALAILFVLIFICKKESKKQAIIGGGVLLFVLLTILGYSALNKVQNGIFGISNVTQINQLDLVIQMDIYKTGDAQDEGIINIIEEKLDGVQATWNVNTKSKIMEEYTTVQIEGYISRCIKNNFNKYLSKTIERILEIRLEYCDEIYLKPGIQGIVKFSMHFSFIYLYIIFEGIYVLAKTIKNRKFPLEQAVLLMLVIGQLGTIILGAQAEYSRLFVVALPIVIISIILHLDEIITLCKAKKIKKLDVGKQAENEISN